MSEKEKKIAKTLEEAISNLPEAKKEYLLGVAEGMSVMAERQKYADQDQPAPPPVGQA